MAWFRDEDGTVISDTRFREICNDCRECYARNNTSAPCHGDELSCHRYDFADTSEFEKEIRAKAIDEFAERLKRRYPIVGSVNRWLNENIDEIAKELKGE